MENQQQQQEQKPSRLDFLLVMYMDLIVRSLIAFAISIAIILSLKAFFDIGNIAVFIFAFLFSILISPLFSRIKIGHLIIDKYIKILNKVFKLENKDG